MARSASNCMSVRVTITATAISAISRPSSRCVNR